MQSADTVRACVLILAPIGRDAAAAAELLTRAGLRPCVCKDFAELAGVSVKALRYYERLGLLTARRTRSGHRRYVQADLGRIETITALKYLGFSLEQIRSSLLRPAVELPRAIAARRAALSEVETKLAVARKAVDTAERATDANAALNALVETVQT